MSLPIKETPILKGKDAVRFLNNMVKAETEPITDKQRKEYLRAKKLYEEIEKNNGLNNRN